MEKFEISRFQTVRFVRKNAISPKVFKRFSKIFLLLKDAENRYFGQKCLGRSYFSFAMVRWKLITKGKIWNLPLPSCTLCQKKCYITKGIQPIFKNFCFCWKMWKIGIWARKFHGRSYFSFAMVRWKLFSRWKIRNFPLSSCTLCQKKCYITKGIQPIFKNFPSAERCGK